MDQKKLAFGVMRLPLLDPTDTTKIDLEATNRMVDLFLERGFTYFDTAAPYHGGQSEHVVRECLVKRHPRESYTLTDKLSLFMLKEAGELEGFLAGQLERCGVDYFDYYLLHAMSKERLEQAEAWGVFDFVAQKKAAGVLRHVGFSFHDRAEVLEETGRIRKYSPGNAMRSAGNIINRCWSWSRCGEGSSPVFPRRRRRF